MRLESGWETLRSVTLKAVANHLANATGAMESPVVEDQAVVQSEALIALVHVGLLISDDLHRLLEATPKADAPLETQP